MAVKRKRSPSKWVNTARYAYGAAKSGYNLYKRFKSMNLRTPQASSDGGGVTQQFDKSYQYRYRRMPYAKKRKYVRKVKNFKSMQMGQLATQIFIRNDTVVGGASWPLQGFTAVHINGINTAGDIGGDDLLALMDRTAPVISDAEPLAATRQANTRYGSIILDTAILDITLKNSGTTAFEMDVYHIVYTNDFQGAANLQALFSVSSAPDGISGSTSDITLFQRGATPFDFPVATKYGVKVLKKTKYFVPVGNTFTYQLKLRKNKAVNGAFVYGTGMYRKKGLTETLLFVGKGVPESDADSRWTIGCTRRYAYRVMANNKNFGQII